MLVYQRVDQLLHLAKYCNFQCWNIFASLHCQNHPESPINVFGKASLSSGDILMGNSRPKVTQVTIKCGGEDSRKDAPKGHLKGLVKSGMGKGRDPRFAQNLLGGLVHMTGLFSISYMACHPSHWRTPSFFIGVGQPPTRLLLTIINHILTVY